MQMNKDQPPFPDYDDELWSNRRCQNLGHPFHSSFRHETLRRLGRFPDHLSTIVRHLYPRRIRFYTSRSIRPSRQAFCRRWTLCIPGLLQSTDRQPPEQQRVSNRLSIFCYKQ